MSPSRAHQNRQRRRLTATEVDLERRQQRALLIGTGYGSATVEEAEASLKSGTASGRRESVRRTSEPFS